MPTVVLHFKSEEQKALFLGGFLDGWGESNVSCSPINGAWDEIEITWIDGEEELE